MCKNQIIRSTVSLLLMVVGVFALTQMLCNELLTGTMEGYPHYTKWLLYGGLLFLSVGLSYIVYLGDNSPATIADKNSDSGQSS